MRSPIDTFSLDDFDRMFAINVKAVFAGTQAAARHMQSGGRIITVGSVTAERSDFPGASVYSMTKGAVAASTPTRRAWKADRLASWRIRRMRASDAR